MDTKKNKTKSVQFREISGPYLYFFSCSFVLISGNKKASQRLPYRSYRLTGKKLAGKKGRVGRISRFAVNIGH
jgi:hypothetical protein